MPVHSQKMRYPAMADVERADRETLARWYRFLPSPGHEFVGTTAFQRAFVEENAIMRRIILRFEAMGGMNPAISKRIGQ